MTRLLLLLLFSSVTLFAQRTPLRVNGTIVDNPNFVTGSTALIGRSGANISVAPTNIANAQIAAGAAIDVSKLSGVAPTVHAHAGEDISSGTVADARIASTLARDSEVSAAINAAAIWTNANGIVKVAYGGTTNALNIHADTSLVMGRDKASGLNAGLYRKSDVALGDPNFTDFFWQLYEDESDPNAHYAWFDIATSVDDGTAGIYQINTWSSNAVERAIVFNNTVSTSGGLGVSMNYNGTTITRLSPDGIDWLTAADGTPYVLGTIGTRSSGNLLEMHNDTTNKFSIDYLGNISFTGGTLSTPANAILWDGSQASRTLTMSLSGATDPVLTAANNSLSLNVPLTFGDGSAASYVLSSSLSGATDPTITFANNQITGTGHFTSNGNITSGGTLVATTVVQAGASSSFLWAGRSRAFSASDGAVSFRNNADSANAGITAGTLTLTPAAADTQAVTVSGGSTTGSGTTRGGHFLHTANTSGNIDGVWTFTLVDTASGSTTKALQIFGGAAGTTSLFNVDKLGGTTALGNLTASGGALALASNFDVIFRRDAAASHQFGTDAASPTHQRLKAHDATGTDNSASHFTLSGGQSTGTGRGGALIGQTSPSGSTGSSANAYSERYHHAAKAVTLTSATATTVATIACPVAKFIGGKCTVTVFATDGTDHQARTLDFAFSAINKAGTITAGIDTPAESVAVSSGSLTVSITVVANGNALDIKVNADSSLTENTLSATVSLPSINSNDTAAVTEI